MIFEQTTHDYYDTIPTTQDFDSLVNPELYVPLPDDWIVGVADIVGSTQEIERGRYKVVNMVGSAVISAQLNAAGLKRLPYVFGGDGAGFAVWPGQRSAAEMALQSVRSWAKREFDIELRVGMIEVRRIKDAGRDVRVARYAPSTTADFAMFSGGGLALAERLLKSGDIILPERSEVHDEPDLTGLSCRWSHMKARHGSILSIVMKPEAGVSEAAFADVTRVILGLAGEVDRDGHPVPHQGPGVQFPPKGLSVEAQAQHRTRPIWIKTLGLLAENFMIWGLFKTNLRVGNFKPSEYRVGLAHHADFRKFDDGLKMTLDCDDATHTRIEAVLREAAEREIIRYGLYVQDEAMMTCLVPSKLDSDHMHFVDGASGGYAKAAEALAA
ncbi:DUF3095 domain-containing protein [Pseudopelagicola sp. nBUS_20]|uniref:DUF3095 domain-containing protein n=1 Tax=Pseudopelagicola sp. nBUS_20 TaxID=3395317 RepID=UPI003EBF9948